MDKLTTVGRTLFALALLGFGVEHLVFREFVIGRAPAWPDSIPGGAVWASLTGVFLVAAGGAILFRRQGRAAALLVGALVFGWAFLRQLPLVATDSFLGPTWTLAARGLKTSMGAWAVAATLPALAGAGDGTLLRWLNRRHAFILLGRVGLAGHMIVAGVLHFRYTERIANLIPGSFPGDAVAWTRLAGFALLAGGLGINVPRTAYAAALLTGLMLFSWFWIVHVPIAFTSRNAAISLVGALASSGIAFVLAGCAGAARASPTGGESWEPAAAGRHGVAAPGRSGHGERVDSAPSCPEVGPSGPGRSA